MLKIIFKKIKLKNNHYYYIKQFDNHPAEAANLVRAIYIYI